MSQHLASSLRIASLIVVTLGCHSANPLLVSSAQPDSALMRRDVRYLASDALEGRGTGTAGNDSAAAYLERRYRALGLRSFAAIAGATECETAGTVIERCGFRQPFTARSVAAAHAGLPSELPTSNVIALIPGRDLILSRQYVVLGAHFDHLGRSTFGAQDPERTNEIRNGADDNASGTAAILELARLLRKNPARRSIVLVNFTGEELGLLGSAYFMEHTPFPLDSVQAMLNFDMVGRLRDDKLIVYGVATASELPGIVNAANAAPALKLLAVGDGFGPSDHSSFYGRNIPVLHFFTDLHEDYHRATDDADKIDVGGMARVVGFAERITRDLANRERRLTFVRAPVRASAGASSRAGSQVYLGSVPDMGAGDVAGMKLAGVSPGSPADKAGLKAGDIIVELAGAPVKDLYSYSEALYSHQPGETIEIVVLREGKRVAATVTLGKRGG
jgi:hypothetical protein